MSRFMLHLILLAVLGLTACGRKGELMPPGGEQRQEDNGRSGT